MTTTLLLEAQGPTVYRIMLIFLLLLAAQMNPVVAEDCTLCTGGGTPALLESGDLLTGITCASAQDLAKLIPSNIQQCHALQLNAFKNCGCPSYPQDLYCSMCEDDSFDIPSKFATIPLDTLPAGTFCGDALFMEISKGLCEETKRAAHHCGCPAAPEPICNAVCRPQSSSSVAAVESQNAGVTPSAQRLLPPSFSTTCDQMYQQSPFMLTAESCGAFQDPAYDIIDESAYCCTDGDNNIPTQPVGGCDLCQGSSLKAPALLVTFGETNVQMTCKDLQVLSFVVTDNDFCANSIQKEDLFDACCLGVTPSPSASTSPTSSSAPTRSPTISSNSGSPSETPSLRPTSSPDGTGNQFNPQNLGEDDPTSGASLSPYLRNWFWGLMGGLLALIIVCSS